jgi:hypothetical protein
MVSVYDNWVLGFRWLATRPRTLRNQIVCLNVRLTWSDSREMTATRQGWSLISSPPSILFLPPLSLWKDDYKGKGLELAGFKWWQNAQWHYQRKNKSPDLNPVPELCPVLLAQPTGQRGHRQRWQVRHEGTRGLEHWQDWKRPWACGRDSILFP